MAYLTDGLIGGILATPGTAQDFALGMRRTGTDGTTWLYVQANGAITQYYWVGIDENYQAAHLTTAMAGDGWIVGASQATFADNDYGWIPITGSNVNGFVQASVKVDSPLYTSATAGVLSENSSEGTKIEGVVNVVSGTTEDSAVEVIMTSPRSTTL